MNKEKRDQIKKDIIEKLSNGKYKSTTAISIEMKKHYYLIQPLLQELLEERKVERDKKEHLTFWRLKK